MASTRQMSLAITGFFQMKGPVEATIIGKNAQLTLTGGADGHCIIFVYEHLSEIGFWLFCCCLFLFCFVLGFLFFYFFGINFTYVPSQIYGSDSFS